MSTFDEREASVNTGWQQTTPEACQPVADRVSLRITRDDYETLRNHLIRTSGKEYAAYLVAGTHEYEDDGDDVLEYLVRDVECIPPFRYTEHREGYVGIPGEVTHEMMDAAATDDAIVDDMAVFVIHSHPWADAPNHSVVDDRAEPDQLAPITSAREGPHGSLIFGRAGTSITGRVWPADADLIEDHGPPAATPLDEVVVLGEHTTEAIRPTASRLQTDDSDDDPNDEMRARQALLHQNTGNAALADADVTVVGLGGLGSLITTQLAHIGVGRGDGRLTLVDPDVVEESNRSRIIGATPADAGDPDATPDNATVVPAQHVDDIDALGTPKVDVAERYISDVDPRIRVEKVREVGESKAGIEAIATADLVISAVDQQAPRRNISQASHQYLRPLIDAGVGIDTEDALSLASRVTVAGAGRCCLDCAGALNEDRATHEQHSEDEPYGVGEQPAVMTVNNNAASRAGFIAHRYLTGLLASDNAPFDTGTFDFATASTMPTKTNDRDNCPNCQDESLFRARGDRAPSPAANLTRTAPDALAGRSDPAVTADEDPADGLLSRLLSGLLG